MIRKNEAETARLGGVLRPDIGADMRVGGLASAAVAEDALMNAGPWPARC